MTIAPLFVKYRTSSGKCYVYDPCTNEIIRIGELVYAVLDDYRTLNTDEMIDKYRTFGEADIRKVLLQLDELQAKGILCDHFPQRSLGVERVLLRGVEQSFDEFVQRQRRFLILELTTKCNLQCEYCCYGEHYPTARRYDDESLPLEVGKAAIKDFMDHHPNPCSIGFYGGEPLLEFDLLQQLVCFAEEYASRFGVEPRFNMTTNGTLLTEEVLHFLVKYQFSIVISLDGPKNVHDRYRILRGGKKEKHRTGSYDIIMKNIERFVELYPDYQHRGLTLTLTATSDIDAIDDFFSHMSVHFPSIMASIVRQPSCNLDGCRNVQLTWGVYGGSRPCEYVSCGKDACIVGNNDDGRMVHDDHTMKRKERQEIQEFANWTAESCNRFQSSRHHFLEELRQHPEAHSVKNIRNKYPISCFWVAKDIGDLHRRSISCCDAQSHVILRCVPGAVRTFCSTRGILYSCERTETGKLFTLGDVHNGIDSQRAFHLVEICRLLGDCVNCVTRRLCSVCPALVSEQEDSGLADALAFQKMCQKQIGWLQKRLAEYTTVMEVNAKVLDKIAPPGVPIDDWLKDVKYLPAEERLCEVELGVEELEEYA